MEKDSIELNKLEPGTTLIIETHNSTYTLEMESERRAKITGGTLKDGQPRFSNPTPVYVYGSCVNFNFRRGEVVKGMRLEIDVQTERNGSIMTSGIKEVEVIGPDKSWRYFMGWKNDS